MSNNHFRRRGFSIAALVGLILTTLGTIAWSAASSAVERVLPQLQKPDDLTMRQTNLNETKRLPFEGAATKTDAELDADLNGKSTDDLTKAFVELQKNQMFADASAVFQRGLVEQFLWNKDADETSVAIFLETSFADLLSQKPDDFIGTIDEFLEKTLAAHPESWQIQTAVAEIYRLLSQEIINVGVEQVDGVWQRTSERDDWTSQARDRVRALQILRDALPAVERELATLTEDDLQTRKKAAYFYKTFCQLFNDGRGAFTYWRLQKLTNIDELPDYEERVGFYRDYYPDGTAAPADVEGNPIFFATPSTFETAQNDGERINWLRSHWEKCCVQERAYVLEMRAQEALQLFGVQTLAQYSSFFGESKSNDGDDANANDGVWSVSTLDDSETIAKLASGIKRFQLPDEYNYFKIWNEIADLQFPNESQGNASKYNALTSIANAYSDRRQYVKAAETWGRVVECSQEFSSDQIENAKNIRSQIIDAWGRIEPNDSKVLGTKIALSYVYRNGKSAEFVVRKIRTDLLLKDVKKRLVANGNEYGTPLQHALFERAGQWLNELPNAKPFEEYLDAEVERRTIELSPSDDYTNRSVNVEFNDLPAGAYFIESKTDGGNKTCALVWTTDVAIVVKSFADKRLYFVADAETGAPLKNVDVEIYSGVFQQQRFVKPKTTKEKTNENGQILVSLSDKLSDNDPNRRLAVLATVRSNDPNAPERFAFYGFETLWVPTKTNAKTMNSEAFLNRRAFFLSDRPIYRPNQTAQFKFWVGTANYDAPDQNDWAGESVFYEIHSPTGDRVVEKEIKLDEFGGFAASFEIPADARLGVYSVQLFKSYQRNDYLGGGSFRLEEYRKPEFEVVVDAPKEPVALGDKFKATINAKYYFGAPVTDAEVTYKVRRSRAQTSWYPTRPWDWFYGNGYWWFWNDSTWYPGWQNWGSPRPTPVWFPRYDGPPEIVLEGTAPIGPDGKLEIEIDSTPAKTIYPNDDQRYEITAEVVDRSRRTIVGSGSVFAAKAPFKVCAWLDRGFYEAGQQIVASFQTRRLDEKPVAGTATVRLFKVEYESVADENGAQTDKIHPIETEVFSQTLPTKEDGSGRLSLSAATPGQYRLSCVVETENGLSEEGAQLFFVRGFNAQTKEKADVKTAANKSAFHFDDLELTPDKAEYAVGEKVRLQISCDRPDATVLLFPKAQRGVPAALPKTITLENGTACVEIDVQKSDMPNFFVEAATVSNGVLYTERREIVVPPEKRVLNVDVLPMKTTVRPGEKAKIELRLTDLDGKPIVGQTVATIYDKSLEQLAGGPNTSDIREFFWKWRRSCDWNTIDGNLQRMIGVFLRKGEKAMQNIGVFGNQIFELAESETASKLEMAMKMPKGRGMGGGAARKSATFAAAAPASPAMPALEMEAKSMASNAAFDSLAVADEPLADLALGVAVRNEMNFEAGQAATSSTNFVEATVRKNLADLAFWGADLKPNDDGVIEIEVDMPENLTTWKIAAWTIGNGLRVGSGTAEIVTRKDVIVRMQKPRFLVQKDEVVLSANVHNYLDAEKTVQVSLEFSDANDDSTQPVEKARLSFIETENNDATRTVVVPANGETRVDWTVRADGPGTATFLMKALTDEESDAIQESIPVFEHGITKQLAVSGSINAEPDERASETQRDAESAAAQGEAKAPREATFQLTVPEERRPETTHLTVRFSPTLAGAIFDALPYLAEYPYGCTEQTLNKFLPLVVAQKTLQDAGLDLAKFENRRANLNAQELGDPSERAKQWNRNRRDPNVEAVFDLAEVRKRAAFGVERLTTMQNSDGGWGWFSGDGGRSTAQLTALVYRGLLLARDCDQQVDANVLASAQVWLLNYQREEALKILRGKLWSDEKKNEGGAWSRWKDGADSTDAFVYFALSEGGFRPAPFDASFIDKTNESINQAPNATQAVMRENLWESRNDLPLFPLSAFGLALDAELKSTAANDETTQIRVETILRRLSQYRENDDENQTVRLDLSRENHWYFWRWDCSEFETQAFYLRLLTRVDRKTLERLGLQNDAPRLVKYLLNNRKNATYWNSTRDTALCVEAFSEYLKQTNELATTATVEVFVDGELKKTVQYSPETIFDVDGTLELSADEIASGDREITLRLTGDGALYYNAYLEFFTLEDPIEKAGLEVKAERSYYKLVEKKDATVLVAGARGQAIDQRVEKFDRVWLKSGDEIVSGDLIEVELTVESKNEYESILLEDLKAAGFEAVETKSGYDWQNGFGAYVEYRDERVCFFLERLPEGKSVLKYRLRAETPGKFSALPAKIWAMYAPELKGNSDEFKANVSDRTFEK